MHAMSQTKDIRESVERELSYDPLVDDSDISVKNINGDVALNGTVHSYPQYLEAAAAARRVAGVKKLQNHLEVVLPSGDYRDDATLTTNGERRAHAQRHRAGRRGGDSGERQAHPDRHRELRQRTDRGRAGGDVPDRRPQRQGRHPDQHRRGPRRRHPQRPGRPDRYALIPDESEVVVDTSGNTVTLTGYVRTWAEHDAAIDAAWMAAGGYDVIDDPDVTRGRAATAARE